MLYRRYFNLCSLTAQQRAVKNLFHMMCTVLLSLLLVTPFANAQNDQENSTQNETLPLGSYTVNPGDVLALEVWNEPTLSIAQILVRPDGFISVPVVGGINAGGKTIDQVQAAIVNGLGRYLKDEPTVVIYVLNTAGSQVYVLGKVLRPGAFPLYGNLDVTQALALAGGLNSFAAENKIKVLRRDENGMQSSIKFKYGQVKDGDHLESNILLQSGDLVLVP